MLIPRSYASLIVAYWSTLQLLIDLGLCLTLLGADSTSDQGYA